MEHYKIDKLLHECQISEVIALNGIWLKKILVAMVYLYQNYKMSLL